MGRVGKTWSMTGECLGKAWGKGDLGMLGKAPGRLETVRKSEGFGECSQDALRSLGGTYELVP